MRFTFKIDVEVSRSEGKFASKDELAEQIEQALSDANPDSLEGENGGQYAVDSWEVSNET